MVVEAWVCGPMGKDEEEMGKMKLNNDSIVLPLPSNKLLEEIQTYGQIVLPKEYVEFIGKYNGAEPLDYSGTFVAENEHEYVIDRFLCLLDNAKESSMGQYDVEVVLSGLEERIIPEEFSEQTGYIIFPIAVLFAGDFLCLDYRKGEKKPEMVVWDHENSGDFDPTFYYVCANFKEFIENMAVGQ